jgi:hypothetical protein
MDPFLRLVRSLGRAGVRFVVIGLSGVNLHARSASELFATQDRDLFIPPHADDALRAWRVSEKLGFELTCGGEPLDRPRDRFLAERVVANRALVRATDHAGLDVDFTLVMAGFEFETVWRERRIFRVESVEVPVARLVHIIESKRRAGREKDRLFFATHSEAIGDLLGSEKRDLAGSSQPSRKKPDGRRSKRRRPSG